MEDTDPMPQRWPATDEWRQQVRARMMALGLTEQTLGQAVGCDQSVVHRLLAGSIQVSKFVPRISKYLKIDLPNIDAELDAAKTIWSELFDALTPEQRELLISLGQQLRRK